MEGPKGKYLFGFVKVGEKGQIVIPKEARQLFSIKPGDSLLLLGDINQGIAVVKPELTQQAFSGVWKTIPNFMEQAPQQEMKDMTQTSGEDASPEK